MFDEIVRLDAAGLAIFTAISHALIEYVNTFTIFPVSRLKPVVLLNAAAKKEDFSTKYICFFN